MIPAIVCGGVFAASLLLAWRLGQFLKGCDVRHADMMVVAEAERIIRQSYGTDERSWP